MSNHDKDYCFKVAREFIKAINDEDALAFWRLLDRQGQGYFIGMWFYVLGDVSVDTIIKLTEEKNFLENTLGPIIKSLKENLGEQNFIGASVYIDDVHAKVPVSSSEDSVDLSESDFIPLILELTPNTDNAKTGNNGQINFTCWKVDTLKCIQVKKE